MDTLSCSLDGKLFSGLLNGLSKRIFFNDLVFTNEYLLQQLFSGQQLEQAEVYHQIDAFEQLLLKAADSNWDSITLEDKLKKHMHPDQLKILVKFWSNESEKVLAFYITSCI